MKNVSSEWFKLEGWKSPNKIGIYPRIERIKSTVMEFPYFSNEREFLVEEIVFDDNSVLSDVIFENSGRGGSVWVVNERFYNFLKGFDISDHAFLLSEKSLKGKVECDENYGVLIFHQDIVCQGVVDFESSRFRAVPYTRFIPGEGVQGQSFSCESEKDYLEILRENSNALCDVLPSELVIRGGIKSDLFALRPREYFVSSSLAEALLKIGATGFDMVPIDFKIIETCE